MPPSGVGRATLAKTPALATPRKSSNPAISQHVSMGLPQNKVPLNPLIHHPGEIAIEWRGEYHGKPSFQTPMIFKVSLKKTTEPASTR